MQVGDRVRWLKANPDGWSGEGIGEIAAYEPARKYFHGTAQGSAESAPTGPAVLILLDPLPGQTRKFDVWVPASSEHLAPLEETE